MGKVMISGVAPQMTKPIVIKANFADNTWEQIIEACQTNSVPDTWLVGDQKNMTINGTDYAIDIIGKNHDDYADGSGKAPLTFQMHDCIYNINNPNGWPMNDSATNVGGWASCKMRQTILPLLIKWIPLNVRSAIKEVTKLTSAGNQSATISTTSDKLFLLSEVEIIGSTTNSKSGEGSQYAYYKAGNNKVKKLNGSAYPWWERSPRSDTATDFCSVHSNGDALIYAANDSLGVSFAFCF